MTPKITIYGSKMSTCTQRVLILLEELKLQYKLHEIDLDSGEQNSKQFLKLNPFGKVPVLLYRESEEDDERILYESRCILRFLSNKHDTDTDYYPDSKCDMWLDIESQELNPQLCLYEKKFKQMQGESNFDMTSELQHLDKVLSIYEDNFNYKYISGNTFTIADIACIPYLNYFVKCQGKNYLKGYPKVYHWFKKVKVRDSVKKILF